LVHGGARVKAGAAPASLFARLKDLDPIASPQFLATPRPGGSPRACPRPTICRAQVARRTLHAAGCALAYAAGGGALAKARVEARDFSPACALVRITGGSAPAREIFGRGEDWPNFTGRTAPDFRKRAPHGLVLGPRVYSYAAKSETATQSSAQSPSESSRTQVSVSPAFSCGLSRIAGQGPMAPALARSLRMRRSSTARRPSCPLLLAPPEKTSRGRGLWAPGFGAPAARARPAQSKIQIVTRSESSADPPGDRNVPPQGKGAARAPPPWFRLRQDSSCLTGPPITQPRSRAEGRRLCRPGSCRSAC
jgi:hypothetical protein